MPRYRGLSLPYPTSSCFVEHPHIQYRDDDNARALSSQPRECAALQASTTEARTCVPLLEEIDNTDTSREILLTQSFRMIGMLSPDKHSTSIVVSDNG